MATNINTILSWFVTGAKPTQVQFWASWQSFWHKDEAIPQSSVQNLAATLNSKADKSQFDAHKTDTDAHADLFSSKEDKNQKGAVNGYAPLNEFQKIAAEYLSIVNDLITGGTTSLLSAEQGKELQSQIDGINIILSSDDINLDTVQELVDAIKEVETSLETILVNDLTTGGITKALTAEMGKSLKALIDGLNTNKVDKVAGERLITAAEIVKLEGIEAGAQVNQDMSGKQDIDNQIFVSASGLVQDSWHGKIVTFTASSTQTVPASGLRDGFKFDGIVDPTVTITTAITAPKSWLGGYSGASITENSIFTFIQRKGDDSKVSIYGL
ncbi:hypothetical protein GON26_01370 [Flavobacterium sp. GA093]|uniref:Uncharacterized protein n=1 Tax=Flavobacterium hydrocarbonoxydans TaxID=2683249 RepID=A0A6I4NMX2_9FLAO|nr:hypothetical protein [Flavobacterium hydrocarbonoxydans]MWB92999.1 hypothetical protein [Flavobacterium hydrocarbonoxydans]